MEFKPNTLWWGAFVGLCVPVAGYGILLTLFDVLSSIGLMSESSSSGFLSRTKTIELFAICCNLIPFNYFKKRRMDYAMRGAIFPTLFFAGWWLYKYQNFLL